MLVTCSSQPAHHFCFERLGGRDVVWTGKHHAIVAYVLSASLKQPVVTLCVSSKHCAEHVFLNYALRQAVVDSPHLLECSATVIVT